MPRGRPAKTIPSTPINLSIPQDLYARLKLHLWSDVEGRVPHGKQSEFFEQLLRDYFNEQTERG